MTVWKLINYYQKTQTVVNICVSIHESFSDIRRSHHILSQQVVPGKLDIHMQKNDQFFLPYIEINSDCIRDLKVRPRIRKLPEGNIGKELHDLDLAMISWIWEQKHRQQK